MPDVTVAERILETVTTSNRASSIVGDLLEEASNRSPLWFWFGVLRIFASHVCRDLRIHWLRMIWLGFSEFLGFLILWIMIAIMRGYLAPGYYLVDPIVSYASLILIGWHVGRRSHGSELASGVSFVCMASIFMVAMLWTATQRDSLTTIMFKMLNSTLGSVPVIFGAFLFRYRVNTRNRKLPLEKS